MPLDRNLKYSNCFWFLENIFSFARGLEFEQKLSRCASVLHRRSELYPAKSIFPIFFIVVKFSLFWISVYMARGSYDGMQSLRPDCFHWMTTTSIIAEDPFVIPLLLMMIFH